MALFDTGPESTFPAVVAGLARAGIAAADVRHVFLSHIHFDHAGAAFHFAEAGASIYVHPRGAPHLLDPTRLVESATRIFGDQMEKLWGRIAPVPPSRLSVLNDGDAVNIGEITVRAIETPGHATHHHVYQWDDSLFGGDVAGVRIGGGPPIPPFVPPELHVEAWLESIDKMRRTCARNLYLPHFGPIQRSIPEHFNSLEDRIRRWSEWFGEQIRAGRSAEEMVSGFAEYEHNELRSGGASEDEIDGYEAADPSYMAVPAAERYWRKYRSEQLPNVQRRNDGAV